MKAETTIARLRRLASLDMPVEALRTLILDLAGELDQEEAKLSRDRERKRAGISTEKDRNFQGKAVETAGISTENPPSRVVDNTSPSLTSGKEEKKEESKYVSTHSRSKPRPQDPEGFADFWPIYPKRHGDADRKGAVKAFRAALNRVDLQTLLQGARTYAIFCDSNEKTGTEFVKQARTWLNADGWSETYATISKPRNGSVKDALRDWVREGGEDTGHDESGDITDATYTVENS